MKIFQGTKQWGLTTQITSPQFNVVLFDFPAHDCVCNFSLADLPKLQPGQPFPFKSASELPCGPYMLLQSAWLAPVHLLMTTIAKHHGACYTGIIYLAYYSYFASFSFPLPSSLGLFVHAFEHKSAAHEHTGHASMANVPLSSSVLKNAAWKAMDGISHSPAFLQNFQGRWESKEHVTNINPCPALGRFRKNLCGQSPGLILNTLEAQLHMSAVTKLGWNLVLWFIRKFDQVKRIFRCQSSSCTPRLIWDTGARCCWGLQQQGGGPVRRKGKGADCD